MRLIERYIMFEVSRLVAIIVGFLIFIFAIYSAQRYLTDAANGTLALTAVLAIVFYKVIIALEMLLPVGLYVSVGIALGQLHAESEITALLAAGSSPLRLYKTVMYFAIPLGILVTLLSMFGRPWAYMQIYRLEQQSQSELDISHLRARKFNVNDHGHMILAATISPDTGHLTDMLIYTPSENTSSLFRAHCGDITNPSPLTPSVALHSGTSYRLDHHNGQGDNGQIFQRLNIQLKPLMQNPITRRKASSMTALRTSTDPGDTAELQWRISRGINALLMALLAVPVSRVKPRQGRFSTLIPLSLLFTCIFYGGNVCRTLVANGALPVIPGVWLVQILMLFGVGMLIVRDTSGRVLFR